MQKKILSVNAYVCYLYQPGEQEGGRQLATDHNWSLKVYNVLPHFVKANEPIVYHLQDGSKQGFVREELLSIPLNTFLPPVEERHPKGIK